MTGMVSNAFQDSYWIAGGELSAPVFIHVQATEQGFGVEQRDVLIHGSGATIAAAVEDFRHALRDHYDALTDVPEGQLSAILRENLTWLRAHLGGVA